MRTGFEIVAAKSKKTSDDDAQPHQSPMKPLGQIRRNPDADQRKVKRQINMGKTASDIDDITEGMAEDDIQSDLMANSDEDAVDYWSGYSNPNYYAPSFAYGDLPPMWERGREDAQAGLPPAMPKPFGFDRMGKRAIVGPDLDSPETWKTIKLDELPASFCNICEKDLKPYDLVLPGRMGVAHFDCINDVNRSTPVSTADNRLRLVASYDVIDHIGPSGAGYDEYQRGFTEGKQDALAGRSPIYGADAEGDYAMGYIAGFRGSTGNEWADYRAAKLATTEAEDTTYDLLPTPDAGTEMTEPDTRTMGSKTVDIAALNKREAQLIEAMGLATAEEQRPLVMELEQVRQSRTALVNEASEIEVADMIVRDHLTPRVVSPYTEAGLHSERTDWIGDVIDVTSKRDISTEMAREASAWFGRVSSEVKSDRDEFGEQAKGMAAVLAGRYGEDSEYAKGIFLDHVDHLAGAAQPKTAGADEDAAMAHMDPKSHADAYFGGYNKKSSLDEGMWSDMGEAPPLAHLAGRTPNVTTPFDHVAYDYSQTHSYGTCPKCSHKLAQSDHQAGKCASCGYGTPPMPPRHAAAGDEWWVVSEGSGKRLLGPYGSSDDATDAMGQNGRLGDGAKVVMIPGKTAADTKAEEGTSIKDGGEPIADPSGQADSGLPQAADTPPDPKPMDTLTPPVDPQNAGKPESEQKLPSATGKTASSVLVIGVGSPGDTCNDCGMDLNGKECFVPKWADRKGDTAKGLCRGCALTRQREGGFEQDYDQGGFVLSFKRGSMADIDTARAIVANHDAYAGTGDFVLDMQTANAIVTVYDALSGDGKEKFANAGDLATLGTIAWKIIGKTSSAQDPRLQMVASEVLSASGTCPKCGSGKLARNVKDRDGTKVHYCSQCGFKKKASPDSMGKSDDDYIDRGGDKALAWDKPHGKAEEGKADTNKEPGSIADPSGQGVSQLPQAADKPPDSSEMFPWELPTPGNDKKSVRRPMLNIARLRAIAGGDPSNEITQRAAAAIVTTHDALSPDNRQRFLELPPRVALAKAAKYIKQADGPHPGADERAKPSAQGGVIADPSGQGVSGLQSISDPGNPPDDKPQDPINEFGSQVTTGTGAADVTSVPTPGGESGYPQPTGTSTPPAGDGKEWTQGESPKTVAFRQRCQATLAAQGASS